ncbi:sulfite exporter TauE/SafE family protein [Athalassotoga saccharophila]|uniref:Probable membrane transporter protein n=1 Tax=Athalassotoga saccharophila TaxID=1441386 RepID=A0A6N4TE68_9BACT|nr:sulfite exporter TauE/SafE family protein [Athalassotoga saccharophila]BBJ29073.1 hypothetical protein ATHSA_p10026 [Athalassotoga saccharophila]
MCVKVTANASLAITDSNHFPLSILKHEFQINPKNCFLSAESGMILGFHPKKVIALTPLIVLFSSFTGFVTYALMGYINLDLIIFGGIASFVGGYLGTKVAHLKLNVMVIKRIIAVFVLILVVKMIIQFH